MNWKFVPNTCTFGNLSAGAVSLLLTIQEQYRLALIFIAIAALFDVFDGFLARIMHCSSDFGKQLDSLADIVSFGVAPAFLVLLHQSGEFHWLSALAAIVFLVCGASRLARFNISISSPQFTGMPITCAGTLLACLSLTDNLKPSVIIAFTVVLSFLMVSRIPFPSLKNISIRK
ncbi:CDP-diacylglycerol--serine O-phosphatidyltransferase [Paenibacillus sp. D2_2]|uniref:CDP-diacylglycerol--serine O-phosphatidyltransferase n=1 Tax=Paenibacillus sp. D2_2 TaxID=3073092 RepID=UPI002814DDF6|nr:CDP-diacylglycerol--serine O-phosphatidyltransferase [Paenibacillus sp. D2_2]WMT43148.1 CDP-diacylglycerol--serine O-phosphatidyltransferase [Paenibacillus sp. D2_2]